MIQGKRILALIPARGGSKGIKGKNIHLINGKPLIAYTIEVALHCSMVDSVLVTTDDEKIAEVSRQYGARVPFLRPKQFAMDQSKTIDAVIHALTWLQNHDDKRYDILLLLQPTQPLRTSADIREALQYFQKNKCRSLASVSAIDENPYLIRTIDEAGKLQKFVRQSSTVRRQDLSKFYKVNGAIYLNYIADIDGSTSFNDNESGYVMKGISIDIDTPNDLQRVEALIKKM